MKETETEKGNMKEKEPWNKWEKGREGKSKGLSYEYPQYIVSHNKPWSPQYFLRVITSDWFMENSSINEDQSTTSKFMLRALVNILKQ